MKNLFTHEVFTDSEQYVPYENPYLTARVSSELENRMRYRPLDDLSPEPSEEQAALKSKEKLYGIMVLISFAFAFVSALVLSRLKLLEHPAMMLIPLAGLVASFVFIYMIKKTEQKKYAAQPPAAKIDFHEVAERIAEANEEARQALGVPEEACVIEVLPYGYKKKGEKLMPEKKTGQFDNSPMTCYVKDGRCCMFDGIALYEIPLAHFLGYHSYDLDYRIDFWLKEEEPTSEKYTEFKLRKVGLLEYKTHTYYGVDIYDEAIGEAFEMLIPGYDFETFLGLVPLPQNGQENAAT